MVPELCNLKANVEVESLFRAHPIVFAGLFGLGNDAKAFDHFRLDSFLFQKSFQNGGMVHNVP